MKTKGNKIKYRLSAALIIAALLLTAALPIYGLTLSEFFGLDGQEETEETEEISQSEEGQSDESGEIENEASSDNATETNTEAETETEVETETEAINDHEEIAPPAFDAGELSTIAGENGFCSFIAPIPELYGYDYSYIWQTAVDDTLSAWNTLGTTSINEFSYSPDISLPYIYVRCGIVLSSAEVIFEPVYTATLTIEPASLFADELLPDYSWYSDADSLFIASARQLFTLALITRGEADGYARDDFSGKTIKLDRDIYINEGIVGCDSSYAPIWSGDGRLDGDYYALASTLQSWLPIGNAQASFNGTFDGGGYSIIGLYINDPALNGAGLFGYVSGTVKNLTVSDFYINAGDNSGAIAGILGGSIINCGVCGRVNDTLHDGTNEYHGIITGAVASNGYAGAVAGTLDGANASIVNSYSDAFVAAAYAGGIAGRSNGNIENCYSMSSCSGQIAVENSGTIKHCFTNTFSDGCAVFDYNFTLDGGRTLLEELNDWLEGDGIIFADAKYWQTIEGRPIPTLYKERRADYDTSWFFEANGDYTLNDEFDLRGFAHIVNGDALRTDADRSVIFDGGEAQKLDAYDFAGATVLLGADITMNNGYISSDLSSMKVFTSIGTDGSPFAGSFDGAHHKITALYTQNGLFGLLASGGSIVNLEISDSYIFGADNVGTFAAKANGTINGCESNSTVTASGANVGGIVGYMGSTSIVINCSNRGTVEGGAYVGGIVGSSEGIVANCFNTANITGAISGGIIGSADNFASAVNCLDTANGAIYGNKTSAEGCYTEASIDALNDAARENNKYSTSTYLYWSEENEISFINYNPQKDAGNEPDKDGYTGEEDDIIDGGKGEAGIEICSVKDGRSLRLFDETVAELATANDVFTAQFIYSTESSDVPTLTFDNPLPIGASIIMTVRSGERPSFYYYICGAESIGEIALTSFIRLGTSDESYIYEQSEEITAQKLLFTIDISACAGIKSQLGGMKISLALSEKVIGTIEVSFISFISLDLPDEPAMLSMSDPIPAENIFNDVTIEGTTLSGSVNLTAANIPENNPHFQNKNYILSMRIADANGDYTAFSAMYNDVEYVESGGWVVLPFQFASEGDITSFKVDLSFSEENTPTGSCKIELYLFATDDPRDAVTMNIAPIGDYEIGRTTLDITF